MASSEPLVFDARPRTEDLSPWSPIAGVPLICRHLRQAARQGIRVATIVVDPGDRAALAQALAWRPVPGLVVHAMANPPVGARLLPVLAVYTADWQPSIELHGPHDVIALERVLLTARRKSIAADGAVAFYVMRPLARLGARLLVGTRVTPNQVTLAALVLGLLAALCAACTAWIAAGLSFWSAAVVDCMDGELARLRLEGSRLGEWLDSLADEISTLSLLLGLSIGLGLLWVGAAGVVIGATVLAKLYADLLRLRLPIDTTQYPWFFGKPSDRAPPLGLARIMYVVSFLFQRDAYVTIVAVLLVCMAPYAAFLLLFSGIAIITVLLLVHLMVTR